MERNTRKCNKNVNVNKHTMKIRFHVNKSIMQRKCTGTCEFSLLDQGHQASHPF